MLFRSRRCYKSRKLIVSKMADAVIEAKQGETAEESAEGVDAADASQDEAAQQAEA